MKTYYQCSKCDKYFEEKEINILRRDDKYHAQEAEVLVCKNCLKELNKQ